MKKTRKTKNEPKTKTKAKKQEHPKGYPEDIRREGGANHHSNKGYGQRQNNQNNRVKGGANHLRSTKRSCIGQKPMQRYARRCAAGQANKPARRASGW